MSEKWASHFLDIPFVLETRSDIRDLMVGSIDDEPIHTEGIDGGDELKRFRGILVQLVKGEIDIQESIKRVEEDLSPPSDDENNGAEAMICLQFSRFYNQAVMKHLLDSGVSRAFVPRCSDEKLTSRCCKELAGKGHAIQDLYDRLVDTYSNGREPTDPVIPGHPFCKHVIKPFHDF